MKYFYLTRNKIKITEGIIFTDGKCVMKWLSDVSSIAIYETFDDLQKIHCHGDTYYTCHEFSGFGM